MARFRRLDVLQTMMDSGLVPVFYHKDLETDKEGASSFFLSSSGPGRIEIMKGPESDKPHIAIRVTDFELACSILKGKGIELEEPKIKSDAKSVFLKGADPAGNRIHLLWNKM